MQQSERFDRRWSCTFNHPVRLLQSIELWFSYGLAVDLIRLAESKFSRKFCPL